ncbi:unnamed protein product [Chondrus crispus]|uniref:Uncharacterized protein n=1 Tax=Chondrus crispus TaxID=2769 RepID=R7QCF0_CHOCR|nr:unnamed protein product [Chondrus crispus]CDF35448.1 unnamed protein product [Chondrus crispus]|eukprot:XP_005715267.1 unnamed protein product [Chondrus crispus]
MYNILTPPRGSPVSEIVLKIGDTSTSFSSSSSSLKLPTSTVVFEGVSGVGPAEITCDGEAAVVVPTADDDGDDLTVVSGGASEPLAKDELVTEYPSSDTEARITSTIRVVNSSPDVLTVSEANAIITEYCRVAECQEIGVRSILEGSALLDIGALVEDADVAKADLRKSFDDCEFQEKTDYACDELELLEVRSTNAIAATVATAGIATWTIILISVVGAIGLVAVLTLAAWAVHRRHASRESESSYSSSGPLGVPDPSDLLYEQSIVRDVYGRGEDGGPSEQAAVDSERAAAMREEFPKPPSSSSLSRGNRSSDASSTYSV